jgi:hypothetical protein
MVSEGSTAAATYCFLTCETLVNGLSNVYLFKSSVQMKKENESIHSFREKKKISLARNVSEIGSGVLN